MKFGSKYTGYMEILRAAEPILHPRTGVVIDHEKPLIAEFGKFGEEGIVIDPKTGTQLIDPGTGRPLGRVATIHGGQWDSLEWQAEVGATDEERELLEKRLMQSHHRSPTVVWPIEEAKLPAPLANWDKLSAARKIALAAELDVLAEALAYEEQQDTDHELVARLSKKLADRQSASAAEDALTAA